MKLRKMERKVLLVAFALSLALSVIGCGDSRDTSNNNPNPNTFTPKGTVSGLLRDAVTNVALVGAKVQIMDRVATTDSSGMFTITNVPALTGDGHNEPYIENSAYPVVIDMAAINAGITAYNAIATNTVKKAFYPSMAYAYVYVYYTSLGESSDLGYGGGYGGAAANATNHDTPVDGFVANMTPFVGKLDANVKMQVVNTSLVPQSGATVYLFTLNSERVQADTSTGTTGVDESLGGVGGGSPGHLVSTQTTDASGYVTFQNIEAKRRFYVKAVIGANQGWWVGISGTAPFVVPASGGPTALTAPSDNLTDVYGLNQSGFVSTSPELIIGAYYSVPLVVRTVDGLAPSVLSVSPANLSDFAIPATGTVDVVFTFSEALRSTTYANNLTRETSVLGGLYANVAVNYEGPKAGNIPHTLAWNDARTTLTVSIPVASMTPASRYKVSILDACNTAGRLTDANGNSFYVSPVVAAAPATLANSSTGFTTAGGFNVAAPVIAKDATSAYTVNWTPVTNAFGYRVYVEAVAGTGFFPVSVVNVAGAGVPPAANLTPLTVATPTTFSLTLLKSVGPYVVGDLVVIGTNAAGRYNVMDGLFAGGKSYNVYVVALSSNGSESPQSNIVAVSETKPAAPTGLARRGTTRLIDWTAVTGATQYTIWVQTLINGAALAGYVPLAATSIDPTYDLAAVVATGTYAAPGFVPAGLPFAGTGTTAGLNGYPLGAKLSYNVAVTTTSATNSLTSDLSTPVLIDDKTALALAQPAFGAIVMNAGASLPTAIPPGIVGGAATTAARAITGAGAWSGVSVNQAAAFAMTATIPVPEQLTYSSAIAAANWTVAIISAGGFAAGKAAIVAPVTAVIDTMPTISNIAYTRAAAGGNVTFTLSYAAPGTNVQAWYGAVGSVLLQTSVTDLNGNVVTNQANGAGNAAGVIIN